MDDETALEMIAGFAHEMSGRLEMMSDINFALDDYKELIELALTFLDKLSPSKLKPLGPVSNARWMCKMIYVFKKYLLRDLINLNENDL